MPDTPFSTRWGGDARCRGGWSAIVDQLTLSGNIIETGTDSYRLAHTHQKNPAMAAD